MNKLNLVVFLIASLLVLEAFAAIKLPIYRKKSPFQKRANAPLGGGISTAGEFYVQLQIGTPAQAFEVQIDTGSTDLLIYDDSCQNCDDKNYYTPSASSSSTPYACSSACSQCNSNNQCQFDDAYGDGSDVNGRVFSDMLTWGGNQANITLGAIDSSTAHFEPTGVDGIFGLAFKTLSSWGGQSAFWNWASQNNLPLVYSMCLTPSGASMTIGENQPSKYQWTPILQNTYMVVAMSDIQVNGKSISNGNVFKSTQTIVDSGTTLMIIPTSAYTGFSNVLLGMCNNGVNLNGICGQPTNSSLLGGNCISGLQSSDIQAYPPVNVYIKGIKPLTLTGADYLITQVSDGVTYYCLGIQGADMGPGVGTILGDVFMQKFNIAFDLDKNRVGFADVSTC
jgi:cathepsin D